jgi:hypothetical protein
MLTQNEIDDDFKQWLDILRGKPIPSKAKPETVAEAMVLRSALLAVNWQEVAQPDLPKLLPEIIIQEVFNLIKPKTELALAYVEGRFDGIKQSLQLKKNQVGENNAILRFHKKSDQHWVVSFLTASDELANKQLRLIMHEQSGKEVLNEPQQLVYEDERWRFRYDVYFTDEQVQQVKITLTVE